VSKACLRRKHLPTSWLVVVLLLPVSVWAQSAGDADGDPATTFFPHSQTARWWISGQDNIVFQAHPSFSAKYSGPNSFRKTSENATSNVATLYTGLQVTRTTEIFVDIEDVSGGGLSDALGIGGFVNVDVVRNPTLGTKPYLGRAMFRQILGLSKETVETTRGPFGLATRVPVRRLELRGGKLSTADFFDVNEVGSDSHFQFLNWTSVNNGAYDYAADTRGYTVGLLAEYHDRAWAARFGEMLMPTVANGLDLEFNLRKARAENLEFEFHPKTRVGQTSIRLLSFVNHANMGVYRTAVINYLAGKTPRPDITAHPTQTTIKYGFGLSLVQELPHHLRAFGRFGWNEGQHQSFAYTEVDETVQGGADLAGAGWRRPLDKVGLAAISNAISADHQHYLALGGLGFLLGDGALSYGRETIIEAYYNAHVWRGLFVSLDLQHVSNPGYNRDRGPVLVPGVRIHLEF